MTADGLKRLWRTVLPFGLIPLAALCAAGQNPRRNWTIHPAIVQIDAPGNVYVVGDVHGDNKRLIRLLKGADLIAANPDGVTGIRWNGGEAVLVFTGDLIDKGNHSLEVIELVRDLTKQAAQKGGRVIALMGNHEAEFLAGPSSKKARDFAAELTNAHMLPAEVASCKGVGEFLCAMPFALRVRDWFFSHGGNTDGRSMSALVSQLERGVDTDGFASPQLVGDNSILEARLGGHDATWLNDGGSRGNEKQRLQKYVDALGVHHLVQGHQPEDIEFSDGERRKKGQMFQRYGLLFLVDTGMSEAVNYSAGAILRITPRPKEEAIAVCPDGTSVSIWDGKTMPELGRRKACGK